MAAVSPHPLAVVCAPVSADRKDRDPLEAEVFVLLEQERQAKPELERGREVERLHAKILGLDRDIRGRGRDDDIVEAGRMRQEKVPPGLADLDPDERDCVVGLASAGAQPNDPVEKHSCGHKLDPSSTPWQCGFSSCVAMAPLIAIPSENRYAAVRHQTEAV